MVSNFALLTVVLKWHHDNEGVKLKWHHGNEGVKQMQNIRLVHVYDNKNYNICIWSGEDHQGTTFLFDLIDATVTLQ